MNILIDVGHPADFLLFREFALQMGRKGNKVIFTAREKDVLLKLISDCGFKYKSFGHNFKSLPGKIFGIAKFDFQLFRFSIQNKPDVFLSAGSIYASHISYLMRKPHIVFEDTGNPEQIRLYKPFASAILTSTSFKRNLGHKQILYEGYHELAYLHSNYFKPDIDKVKVLIDNEQEKYIIVRFVSWSASHDLGFKGFSLSEKIDLVTRLSAYARVYISSESVLPDEIKSYNLPLPPKDLHHALAFASLVIGEGATVAAEAAVLGTPAIYINPQPLGYLEEMESYGLVWNYRYFSSEVLTKAKSILGSNNKGNMKCDLQSCKIEVTAFMGWFVENWPESFKIMKGNPDYQGFFKQNY